MFNTQPTRRVRDISHIAGRAIARQRKGHINRPIRFTTQGIL